MISIRFQVRFYPLDSQLSTILRVRDFLTAVAQPIMLLPSVLRELVIVRASVADLGHARAFERWFVPHEAYQGRVRGPRTEANVGQGAIRAPK